MNERSKFALAALVAAILLFNPAACAGMKRAAKGAVHSCCPEDSGPDTSDCSKAQCGCLAARPIPIAVESRNKGSLETLPAAFSAGPVVSEVDSAGMAAPRFTSARPPLFITFHQFLI